MLMKMKNYAVLTLLFVCLLLPLLNYWIILILKTQDTEEAFPDTWLSVKSCKWPAVEVTYSEDLSDPTCRRFVMCGGAQPVPLLCPAGHIFDRMTSRCRHSPPVTCPYWQDDSRDTGDTEDFVLDESTEERNMTVSLRSRVRMADSRHKCPIVSPYLNQDILVNHVVYTESQLEEKFSFLVPGGSLRPPMCRAVQRLAVIIPYRDQFAELMVLLNHLIPLLVRQQADFMIFLVEQSEHHTFNRGMLNNIGYTEAFKIDDFECIIFHDVNLLPLSDQCLYRCTDHPRHMVSWIDNLDNKETSAKFYGGVIAFTRDQYREVNGESNLFFDLGGGDLDLKSRVKSKGYKLLRYPKQVGRYRIIKKTWINGHKEDEARYHLKSRSETEGLDTLRYEVHLTQFKPLYTWLLVTLDMEATLHANPVAFEDQRLQWP